MRAVISQFSGPYSPPPGPLKYKVVFAAKLLHDLSPNFRNLIMKQVNV